MKERILEIFEKLKSVMTVSGFEVYGSSEIRDYALSITGDFFESSEVTHTGSVILYHKAKKQNAKTLLLDAHIDTIGLIVKEILEGGFVRMAPIGGIDKRLLVSSEIEIYGKSKVRGIFTSIPPHLSSKDKGDTLPAFDDFFVDTGMDEDVLSDVISVGDPAVFVGKTEKLLGDRITSCHLDDKICCAALLYAIEKLSGKNIDCNVTLLFSSGEETHGGGASFASFLVQADGAVALDVNFAKGLDVPEYISGELSGGAMISYSPVTDRRMTDIVVECAEKVGAKHKVIAEVLGTGTNADTIERANRGTPCAVLSVPILYMHTPSEVCSLSDVLAVSDIVSEVIQNFDKMAENKKTQLGKRVLKGGEPE